MTGDEPQKRVGTSVRAALAGAWWRVSRWTVRNEPQPPPTTPRILIGAPHTSNWDFPFMLGVTWKSGLAVRWLGKDALFRGAFGPIMRGLGGVAVDRAHPAGLVDSLLEQQRRAPFLLVIAPEGTRSGAEFWKSGFYRIARDAGLPVTLGFIDRPTMTTGLGPTINITGNVAADMDLIREFYADKSGFQPQHRIEPRLRDETGTAA